MRITRINATPPLGWPSKETRSYLFKVSMWCSENSCWMYYGGKRTLENLDETVGAYVGSSDVPEYNRLYATSEEVKIEYLNFDNKKNIGTGEIEMLTNANASKSPQWFNQTNGGGADSKGFTGMKLVYELNNKLQSYCYKEKKWTNDVVHFPIGFMEKADIKISLSPEFSLKNSRAESGKVLTDHYPSIKEGMAKEPHPNNWKPLVLLMPKKPTGKPMVSKDKPKTTGVPLIVGGNHKGWACVETKQGYGLNTIEIPYSIWSKLSNAEIRALGNLNNPINGKPEREQSIEDAVVTIIDLCDDNDLTKKVDRNGVLVDIFDVKHDVCKKYLKESRFNDYKVKKIFREAQTKVEKELATQFGASLICWQDESLALEANEVYKSFLDDVMEYWENEGWITYKISGSHFDANKVMQQFEKTENKGKTKLRLFPYFKNSAEEKAWEDSEKNKNGGMTGLEQWKNRKKLFFSQFTIEETYLPVTTTEFDATLYKPAPAPTDESEDQEAA